MVGCIAATVTGQGGEGWFCPDTTIKHAIIPVYLPSEAQPAVVLRVDRVFPDLERRGFFRIGVLPLEVADGVTFEFAATNRVSSALAELQHRLEPPVVSRRAELRRVKFVFLPEIQPRLEARRMRLAREGQWQLLDGVCLQTLTGTVHTASARLQVTGPRAGEVTWETGRATNLFSLSPPLSSNSTLIQPRRPK